jgi:hypothetical protein
MTPEELAEIKARCEKATPGPWCWWGDRFSGRGIGQGDEYEFGIQVVVYLKGVSTDENADFIAHSRTDIPALVAEVERLRAALEQIIDHDNPSFARLCYELKQIAQATLKDNAPANENLCICEGGTGRGHYNAAGGYCCPHHGDTCGFHPEYSGDERE